MSRQLAQVLPAADTSDQFGFAQLAAYLWQLVHTFGRASGTLAVQQYAAARAEAGITSRFTPTPAGTAPLEQVTRTLGWATTAPTKNSLPVTKEVTDRRLLVAAERMVLDVGRQTIIDNTNRDRKAHSWARVTEPAPCAFCALLATRGAVYRSEQSADFKSHDHCRCHAEPIFTAYEPPARVREWQALYAQATAGTRGAASLTAFRKAFDQHTS